MDSQLYDHLNYENNYNRYTNSGPEPGYNGLSGFKTWECYMMIKYGKPNSFGIGRENEYLIELPIYPESVNESISAEWQPQNVLGRTSPLSAYVNTSLKSVNFSLDLHRDFLTGSYSLSESALSKIASKRGKSLNEALRNQSAGNQIEDNAGPFDTRGWYVNINKMLQMSCYPQYTDSGLIPPITYFVFGQMILKGYVTSYSTSWKKPIINTFYGWNTVDISMECYPDSIISASDIMSSSGSASTQNTYNTRFPSRVGNSNVMRRSDTQGRANNRSSVNNNIIDT